MIVIKNKAGDTMQLSRSMNIPFERNNTLFNNNNIFKEDLMYSGSAPLSPSNKIFFNGGHRVEASSDLYQFFVTVYLNQHFICAGELQFTIKDQNFDFTIKPNYAAIRDIAVTYTFQNIRFNDVLAKPAGITYANYMKATATNPDDYNAVFFPIFNPKQFEEQNNDNAYYFVNAYTSNNFTPFKSSGIGTAPFTHTQSPFFKLTYILKKCCEFLGFKAEGNIFSDAAFIKKVIYTRIAHFNQNGDVIHYNSNMYMPEMLLSDFIKSIAFRYQLCFSFDYALKKVNINTFKHLKENGKTHDLTKYAQKVSEIKRNEDAGYSVRLVPDADDLTYDEDLDDFVTISPTKTLKTGDGTIALDLKIDTLQNYKSIFGELGTKARQVLKDITGRLPQLNPSFQTGGARPRNTDVSAASNIIDPIVPSFTGKLRVVNYEGLLEFKPGNFYPQSSPDLLNQDDAYFYNFLSQSKAITEVFYLPISVFNQIQIFDKIAFKDQYGSYHVCLIEKISTDLKDTQLLPVEFILRPLKPINNIFEFIQPTKESEENILFGLSAFFDDSYPISFEVWFGGLRPVIGGATETKFTDSNLLKSASNYGAGGTYRSFLIPKASIPAGGYVEFRFYSNNPVSAQNGLGLNLPVLTCSGYKAIRSFTTDVVFVVF